MKVLFVNCCIRGEESRTLRLCRAALDQMQKTLGDVTVEELCLDQEDIRPLHHQTLAEREALCEAEQWDHPVFRYARQFAKADCILIGAPYWEYQFPALLRCYLEHISVGGLTFVYGEEGQPITLCQAKRLFYVTTTGGPVMDRNCGFDYVKTLTQSLFSIPDVEGVAAENLDVWDTDVEAVLQQAEQELRAKISAWK